MNMGTPEYSDIFQIVFVVEDLEETLSAWIEYVDFNTATIKRTSTREMTEQGVKVKSVYKGNQAQCFVKTARFSLGGMDFRFVEPENKAGGDPYSDFLAGIGPGMHHLCIGVADREEMTTKYKSLGYPVYAEYMHGDISGALFDFREEMGLILEVSDKTTGPLAPQAVNRKCSSEMRSIRSLDSKKKDTDRHNSNTDKVKLKLDLVCQVALAVKDIEKAVKSYGILVGLDENECKWSNSLEQIRDGTLTPQIYNGIKREYSYRQVNFPFGGMDIELLSPVADSPSDPFHDFLDSCGPGIHHLNIRLANREEGIGFIKEKLGIGALLDCYSYGRHCAYFDMRKELGLILEVGSRVVGPRSLMSDDELAAIIYDDMIEE